MGWGESYIIEALNQGALGELLEQAYFEPLLDGLRGRRIRVARGGGCGGRIEVWRIEVLSPGRTCDRRAGHG